MKTTHRNIQIIVAAIVAALPAAASGFALEELSAESKACVECHKKESDASNATAPWRATKTASCTKASGSPPS